MRVAIFFLRARSQRLVLASLKRSLHLWHPRVQKNSLAFQATAGEYALRPATRTEDTCRRPDELWRGQGSKGQAPGSAEQLPWPAASRRDWGESSGWVWATAGQSQGGYPCKELICTCLVTRVGRKGGSAPLNSSFYVLCPRLPGENPRKGPRERWVPRHLHLRKDPRHLFRTLSITLPGPWLPSGSM